MTKERNITSQEAIDLLEAAVRDLSAAVNGHQDPGELDPILAGHPDFLELRRQLIEIREFVLAIANGELGFKAAQKGYLIGALKTLQANLRHLTWQAQMVSSGDYSQRVDFLGEFSTAFNSMIEQLSATVCSLEEGQERFRQMAITDALTGLYNRGYFFTLAETEMSRAFRYGLNISILMLDLDHFKKVNDSLGHQVGDLVLVATARVLTERLRGTDIVARYGGEEFVIVLPESRRKAAMTAAEKIRCAVADYPVEVGGNAIKITVSLGASHWGPDQRTGASAKLKVKELITAADVALYRAKNAGRNRVENSWSR